MPNDASPGPDRPAVFVSYSHKDKGWKDLVVGHLQVLEDVFDLWDDHRLAAGDAWRAEIETALDRAAVAVLLISKDFLISPFIRDTEVPRLLARSGVRVIPVFVRPCAWKAVKWLAAIEGRPRDGRALSKLRKATKEQHLADLALEIQKLLGRELPPLDATLGSEGEGGGVPPPWEGGGRIRGEARRGAPPSAQEPRLDIGRLPTSGPLFVGREPELAQLDAAWEDPRTHVLTFVAFGGVGKSTLVARWLDPMAADGWRGARRVLDWSFYSQGTEERVTSAERFLDHALGFFGDPDPKQGAARDRGLRLAELVRREKTLLVLDGIEPLQHPLSHPLTGRLKDPGLAALLKSLAAGNPGLCVVTTRERIADLESFPRTAPQVDLETLSPEIRDLLGPPGVPTPVPDSRPSAIPTKFGQADVFISHAHEDKEFARPLAEALRQRGLTVWYDEYVLLLGDSLRQVIERGLATARFGVVILSPSFFAKQWPQRELDALLAREISERAKVLLPVWHNLTLTEVAQHTPLLADRLAVSTARGLAHVVDQIVAVLKAER